MTLIDPKDLGANGNPVKEWIGARKRNYDK